MRNSSNVITLNDRRQRCDGCYFSSDCLVEPAAAGRKSESAKGKGIVFRRGAHLFRAGDAFERLYLVRSGAVKTYQIGADGEQRITSFHLPGDIVGLDSIGAGVCASSAVALDTTGICSFSYRRLRELGKASEAMTERLLGSISAKLRGNDQALLALGHKSADERMAWFLLGLADAQARRGFSATEINLPMSRMDIGSYLTLAVETVSRVLTRLQANGIIEVRRNQVRVKSPEKLRVLAKSFGHSDVVVVRPSRRAPTYPGNLGRRAATLQSVAH